MQKSRLLVENALLAATVCLLTLFLRLPLPLPQGYVHLGDTAIFMGALLLGRKGAPAAGIGSALSDLLSGFALYAPATLLIKALMGFFAGLCADRSPSPLLLGLVFLLCGAGMALGYLAYEWALFGWAAAVSALIPNLGQGIVSALLGFFSLPLMRRIREAMPK